MLPLSYQGFGFTAILLMVFFLSVVELVKWLKGKANRDIESVDPPAQLKPLKEQIPRNPVRK